MSAGSLTEQRLVTKLRRILETRGQLVYLSWISRTFSRLKLETIELKEARNQYWPINSKYLCTERITRPHSKVLFH